MSSEKRRCVAHELTLHGPRSRSPTWKGCRSRLGVVAGRNFSGFGALAARIFGRSFSMANQERSAANKEFDKASGTIDDIQHDLQVVRDDLSRLAQQVASLLSMTGSQ